MHPNRQELIKYADKGFSGTNKQAEITAHIDECEFCAEFISNYKAVRQAEQETELSQPLPQNMRNLANRLFMDSLLGRVIELNSLSDQSATGDSPLIAAHGVESEPSGVKCIATLYSENPELVMRLMQDLSRESNYLHLIADTPELTDHVLVQIPEYKREFVTDENGIANIDLTDIQNIGAANWQIKMPDAVFELEQLKYEPEKFEYSHEQLLKTDRGDKIRIRLEGRTESKLLSIEVLKLAGQENIGEVTACVTCRTDSDLKSVPLRKPVSFGPVDANATIQIRLYK